MRPRIDTRLQKQSVRFQQKWYDSLHRHRLEHQNPWDVDTNSTVIKKKKERIYPVSPIYSDSLGWRRRRTRKSGINLNNCIREELLSSPASRNEMRCGGNAMCHSCQSLLPVCKAKWPMTIVCSKTHNAKHGKTWPLCTGSYKMTSRAFSSLVPSNLRGTLVWISKDHLRRGKTRTTCAWPSKKKKH